MNSKYILILAILIILVGAVAFVSRNNDTAVVPEESAATSTQATTTAAIDEEPDSDTSVNRPDIQVTSPKQNGAIVSPLVIEGQATGGWYFEATFPVVLVNWDGLIIAQGYVEAQDDWMTEKLVPFKGELAFTKPEYNERGALILKKSNPSGLPENDDAIEIPIRFQ